jgi:tetratricopeptide (TPR) repeat protein
MFRFRINKAVGEVFDLLGFSRDAETRLHQMAALTRDTGFPPLTLGSICCLFIKAVEYYKDFVKAELLYRGGELDAALAILDRIIEGWPLSSRAWMLRGTIKSEIIHRDSPLSDIVEAWYSSPTDVRILVLIGLVLKERGDIVNAIIFYENAIKIDPNFAPAHNNHSVALLKMSKDEDALRSARIAYSLDTTEPIIAANLAKAYHYNDEYSMRDKMMIKAQEMGFDKIEELRTLFSRVAF